MRDFLGRNKIVQDSWIQVYVKKGSVWSEEVNTFFFEVEVNVEQRKEMGLQTLQNISGLFPDHLFSFAE